MHLAGLVRCWACRPDAPPCAAAIVVNGSSRDSRIRRMLVGESLSARLRERSVLPVLLAPSMEYHCPGATQAPATLRAMQAHRLLQLPHSLTRASAPAA